MRPCHRVPLVLVIVLATSAVIDARAADDDDQEDTSAGRWDLSVVPRFTLSNDEGFGIGLRGTAFWYRWDERPYKTAVSFQAFGTTRFVQHHYLRVDAIDAFNLPLRVTAEAGYYQTLTFNYCGLGANAACDPLEAKRAARSAGLTGDDAERFARRYYMTRYLRPYGSAVVRWRLSDKPHRPELVAGWRGHFYQPGDWVDEDGDGAFDLLPYAGSLYASRFDKGEVGFASVLQLGASLDDRDHEPDPSRGYFVEASGRIAAPALGSRWTFFGMNTTLLLFVPLLEERRLVLASRYVVDALVGDAPVMELARVGGSRDYFALGGADLGRGIRQQRFPGGLKVLMQQELRSALASFSLFEQDLRAGVALFVDAGWVAADALRIERSDVRLHYGVGAGLRVNWNENFVMRVDVAVSPTEGFAPFLYTKPDHPY